MPTVIPNLFAKITARTSMPSMAPPNRIAMPLPIPEISPPKMAQRSRSDPASGDTILTSTGSTSVISHAPKEYTATV